MSAPRDAPTPLGTSVFIEQPEGTLHVITRGDSGPAVLLLSGAGNDNASLSWRHTIPALAEHHRVFALDWPKQGESSPWQGTASHSRMLACIDAVLAHFSLRTASLVGLSQGGALALAFAIEHPDKVDRVVALAPAGIISFPPVVHQLLWLTARLPLLHRTLPTLFFRHRAVCAWFARTALFGGPVTDFDDIVDEYHADVLARGSGASDWQNGSIGFTRMNVDLRPRLPEIRCPVMIIQGGKDVAVSPAQSRAAAEAIPGARFELIADGGHWTTRQHPERVNALITEFLGAEDR